MAFPRIPNHAKAGESQWPWCYREAFIERLRTQGYSALTIKENRRTTGRLCEAIEKRGLDADDLDGATIERLQRAVLSGVAESHRTWEKFCLRRFIDIWLRPESRPRQSSARKS
jgi:hypothetical protein